ncbi:MAG: monovalent cation:proton antiporter-2 (CPA2) family protein [Bdellovibrionales bacterium]|nr:monovalent cation:proton antiporter-2 (CPA2) family protein [Bdellovibrionales bacterium]
MTLHVFLISTFWFLLAAVVVAPLFKKLSLGSVLGYMTAGAIIGPWGLKLITDVDSIAQYAEMGVVFLLFVIGLELQPKKLWAMRQMVFGLGGAQVLLTTIALTIAFSLLGMTPLPAMVCGFALSLSSTAFALQLMTERKQLNTAFGQSAFSVLLFQDLSAIPALALIPLFAASSQSELGFYEASISAIAPSKILMVVLVIGLLFVVGKYLLRPVLRVIAWTGDKEIFTSAALLLVIGVSLLIEMQGLSMGLGAFIAGVILADSEYRHEIEANISPFKGLLLGLFFVSIGLGINFGLFLKQGHIILALALGLMAIKYAVIYVLSRTMKLNFECSQNIGLILCQGGEFAFVIFAVAVSGRLLDPKDAALLVGVVTTSLVLTPIFFLINEFLIQRMEKPARPEFDQIVHEHSPDIIIAGFGRVGQITGRLLRVIGHSFTALELDPGHVEVVRKFGHKVYYGDASRLDLLESAGAKNAKIFLLAVDDPESSVAIASAVKTHYPHLKIIARARNRQHAFELMDLGIENIYRETLPAATEMAGAVLKEVGLDDQKVEATLNTFRVHDQKNLVEQHFIYKNETELIAFSRQATDQLEKTLRKDLEPQPKA